MSLNTLLVFLARHSGRLLKVAGVLLVLLVVLDALPFVVDKAKAHTAAERLPGFWAAYGFVGAVLLIVLAKWLGKMGLQKAEAGDDD